MAATKWKPRGESYTDKKGVQWRWDPGKKEYIRNYGVSPAAYVERKAKQALTGVVNTYKRVGTSALDKWNTSVENRKRMMIGEGSEDNPEFITNRRGTTIKNPNFTLPNRQDLSIQNTASIGDGTTNYAGSDTGLYMVNGFLQPRGSDVGLGTDKATQAAENKDNMNEVVTAPGPTTNYLKEWNTDMPTDAKSVKVEGSDLPNSGPLKSDVFTLGADGKPLGVMSRARRRKWDANNQALLKKNALTIANRTYSSGNIGTGSG